MHVGRNLLDLLRGFDIEGNVRAEVLALPPGHPYLRLPLQFVAALEERLLSIVTVDELEQLRKESDAELGEPGRWGTTFTLVQCWGPERGVAQSTSSAASVLQASGFRRDVTVFRLNATAEGHSGSGPAFRRNEAEHVYTIEAAHNPEVAGSNPAPATRKALLGGAFCLQVRRGERDFRPLSIPIAKVTRLGVARRRRSRRSAARRRALESGDRNEASCSALCA